MGYKFSYPTVGSRNYPTRKPMPGWILPTTLIFLCFIGIAMYNRGFDWLLPGNPEITEAALKEMIDKLSAGEAFSDAVTAFCREIIAGA